MLIVRTMLVIAVIAIGYGFALTFVDFEEVRLGKAMVGRDCPLEPTEPEPDPKPDPMPDPKPGQAWGPTMIATAALQKPVTSRAPQGLRPCTDSLKNGESKSEWKFDPC